jgi:uncharacterized membrane protein
MSKINFSKLKIIKIITIIVLIFSILIKFSNLETKAYNADEVRGLYRLSGYTRQEIVEQVFNGKIIGVSDLQYYQTPNPDKNLKDAINSLAENPEHTPLYYLISRFWIQITDTPVSARVASVVISLLVFPCLYWLCWELFDLSLVGWIAMILVAISPYHILLSQGAREYSLWTLTTIFASAALLQAIRVKTTKNWLIYAVSLAIGFYSHLFFVLVAFVHSIYIACIERFRFTKTTISYLLASLIGVLTFIPWIWVIIKNFQKIEEKTVWVRNAKISIKEMLSYFFSNLGNVFVDFNNRSRLENLLDIAIFALTIYSLYFLIKKTQLKTWLLIILLIIVSSLAQFLPDLILEGKRSAQARYFIPCYLALELAVSYTIASYLNYQKIWQKSLGAAVLTFLIIIGFVSGVVIAKTNDWDYLDQGNTANAINIQLAPLINKTDQPLVISEASHSFLLGLSYLVNENVKFQLFDGDNSTEWKSKINLEQVKGKFSDVFIYFPSKEFLEFFEQNQSFQTKDIFSKKLSKIIDKNEHDKF